MIIEKIQTILRGLLVSIKLNLVLKNCRAGKLLRVGKNCRIRVRKSSNIVLGDNVSLGDGVKLSALNGGSIVIGDNVGLGDYDQLVSHKKIQIDKDTNIAPFVFMYDHDHIFGENGVSRNSYTKDEIHIGARTWIAANSVILKGTQVGDNCLVGAGSIVKGKIEANCKLIQKRVSSITNICLGEKNEGKNT